MRRCYTWKDAAVIWRKNDMKYPKFLPQNGTIGFVAPSFGCATEPYYSAFMHALDKFHRLGYQTKLGPNCLVEKGIGISNNPKKCGAELNEAYCDGESDVLISCGGGELMCEVLSYMDFERMKKAAPKWYMGFSDNTNFTFLSATYLDVAAIYGPCAAAFGMEPWPESVKDAFDVLTGEIHRVSGYELWEREGTKDEEHPFEPYNVTEPVVIHSFIPESRSGTGQETGHGWSAENQTETTAVQQSRAGENGTEVATLALREMLTPQTIRLEGRLIGGCMDCLVNLLGTEFDHAKEFNERYKDEKIIWFLESCDLGIMAIRRAIWQMKHAGWFEHVGGFLIGRPLCFGEEAFGIDQYRAVTDLLAEYNVPVIMDLDIGHLAPMMPVVAGATAIVDVEGNNIQIEYTWK